MPKKTSDKSASRSDGLLKRSTPSKTADIDDIFAASKVKAVASDDKPDASTKRKRKRKAAASTTAVEEVKDPSLGAAMAANQLQQAKPKGKSKDAGAEDLADSRGTKSGCPIF